MRIACLQFAPEVGDVDNNLNRADAILDKADPKDLDLLVLPELAFTGYNFKSLGEISPFLEPTTAGISTLWAKTTALKHNCVVTVGYPETVDVNEKWPTSPEYYNSAVTVNKAGDVIANYRKSFLYYTDETWALEGRGFYGNHIDGLGDVAMGICMDLNPYKFEAPWNAWEFAYHVLDCEANLVILSMAWLTYDGPEVQRERPDDPDMDTLSYWLKRLEPLIRGETEGEIVVVFANRTGVEGNAVYAGTSTVLGIDSGEVKVYGILGRGQRELLIVDTENTPHARLVSAPIAETSTAANASDVSTNSAQSKDSESSIHTGSLSRSTPDMDDIKDSGAPSLSPSHPHSSTSYVASKDRDVEENKSPKALNSTTLGGHQKLQQPRSPISQDIDSYAESTEPALVTSDPAKDKTISDTDIRAQVQSASPGHAMKSTAQDSRRSKVRPNSTIW
ncbi:hypothetical protein B7463_g2450, partial [Scytalidium lignicola]